MADVHAAAALLSAVAAPTPVLTSAALDRRTRAEVWIKCENLQRTGSFKFRGAYTALARLGAAERAQGVIAFSSGNHAIAVATAARERDTPAVIVMPADAPPGKLASVAALGARVVTFDRYTEDRFALTERLAADHDLIAIPPYDHPDVIAGAGTTTLELLEQTGALDTLVIPLGGGGQLAGAGVVTAAESPATRLVGVETATGDKTRRSLRAGRRIRIPVPRTIADGVTGETPGELTFAINRRHLDDVVVVHDHEILAAMAWMFEETKLVVEPTGALGIAALLAGRLEVSDQRLGVVVSGGNIELRRFHALMRSLAAGR
ncbi:pyridoxal-phosphate dependent enzyme [Pseudonocardia oceani]|uniref:pyridoxal-phosphate dependent enzyme n=1 Tax=Pseudonocardia oceani TaxID=2792013 RepID=UPI0027E3528C|nr:pyridoxal-phosphate dependent enzyme [Pseudonocardia oceani]